MRLCIGSGAPIKFQPISIDIVDTDWSYLEGTKEGDIQLFLGLYRSEYHDVMIKQVDIFGFYNPSEEQKNKSFSKERDQIVSLARPNDVYKIYAGRRHPGYNYNFKLSYMKVVINGNPI